MSKLKKIMMLAGILSVCFASCTNKNKPEEYQKTEEEENESVVYMTNEISAESLVKMFEVLNVKPEGRVGVKISTGDGKGVHALSPNLIKDLVQKLNANIIECNTAYEGTRHKTDLHWETIKKHGYDTIAKVDIMDEEGEIKLPIKDGKHLKYDIVGSHIDNYDFIVNLAHFKGHQMAGFGGVLKNQSIGFASTSGKAYIHSAGTWSQMADLWEKHVAAQDDFLESMAEAAKAVADKFQGKIVYIAVMNNMSIDCDCNGNPAQPLIKDFGILASTDPVALDKACLDIIFNMESSDYNNTKPLKDRINQQNGKHIVEYAEKIGLGTTKYILQAVN